MNSEGKHVQKEHDYDNTRGFKTMYMVEKKKIKSSPEQLAFLIDYMNKYPHLARGFPCASPMTKMAIEKQWQGLTRKLNSLRGPSKSMAKWKQAWRDFRYNLKKRAGGNFKEADAYRRYRLLSTEPAALDVSVPDLDPEDLDTCVSDNGQSIKLMFSEDSAPNPEDIPMIINALASAASSVNEQVISTEHESTSPPLTPKVEDPDCEILSETEAPVVSEISAEVQDESPTAIESPIAIKSPAAIESPVAIKSPVAIESPTPIESHKACKLSARKQRIARRLGSLLKLEESKIQIQKERNRILAQKNTISAEKVAAINRLTDVLQTIANNLIDR